MEIVVIYQDKELVFWEVQSLRRYTVNDPDFFLSITEEILTFLLHNKLDKLTQI